MNMEHISSSVKALLGKMCPAFPLGLAIKEEWTEIVGEEMSLFSSFSEIKFGMNDELCIVAEVLNSASILFKYHFPEIKDRISKITGYAIDKINLIIKQVSNIGIEHEYKDAA